MQRRLPLMRWSHQPRVRLASDRFRTCTSEGECLVATHCRIVYRIRPLVCHGPSTTLSGGHPMRTAITITFALFSATGAQGQTAVKNVTSGNSLKLSFFNSTNPDCSSRGPSTVRLVRSPEHGRVSFRHSADFPSSRSQCHQRRVPGTALYTSAISRSAAHAVP
jgi:hypothetical protein